MTVNRVVNQASIRQGCTTYHSNEVETRLIFDPIIVKFVDKEIAEVGDNLTYTVTVDNPSLVALTNVVFTDTLDDNLNYVYESFKVNGVTRMPVIEGQTLSYTIAQIEPTSQVEIEFQARIA